MNLLEEAFAKMKATKAARDLADEEIRKAKLEIYTQVALSILGGEDPTTVLSSVEIDLDDYSGWGIANKLTPYIGERIAEIIETAKSK